MQEHFVAYNKRREILASSANPFAKGVARVEGELVPSSHASRFSTKGLCTVI